MQLVLRDPVTDTQMHVLRLARSPEGESTVHLTICRQAGEEVFAEGAFRLDDLKQTLQAPQPPHTRVLSDRSILLINLTQGNEIGVVAYGDATGRLSLRLSRAAFAGALDAL